MTMSTEIEFSQTSVPKHVTEPLEYFPFTKEIAKMEKEERDFVER